MGKLRGEPRIMNQVSPFTFHESVPKFVTPCPEGGVNSQKRQKRGSFCHFLPILINKKPCFGLKKISKKSMIFPCNALGPLIPLAQHLPCVGFMCCSLL